MSPSLRRLRGSTLLLSGGLVLLVLVALGGAVALARDRGYNRLVIHTLEVQKVATATLGAVVDTETAQRGYLLTGAPGFLPQVERSRARAAALLSRLEALVADNPAQAAVAASLRPRLRERFAVVDETLALMAADRRGDAIGIVRQGRGLDLMRLLRADIARIVAVEEELLHARRAAAERSALMLLVLTIAGLVLATLLTLFAIRSLSARTREADAARATVQELNTGLEETVAERTADLRLANDEIQRFAYIVSHDLRSPLVNIMGFTSELQAVQRDLAGFVADAPADTPALDAARVAVDEDMPEALGFIHASTAKMDRLINAILGLSRQGRRVLNPETIDLTRLAEGIGDTVRHQLDEGDATLTVEPMPSIVTDRVALEQVIANLVENALKYTAAGRPAAVRIGARERAGFVDIEVADNGRGIDARDHERVFDLFRRSGAQDRPGEGIGLANVRATIRRLGGTVTLKSELGNGASFVIALPKVIPAAISLKDAA